MMFPFQTGSSGSLFILGKSGQSRTAFDANKLQMVTTYYNLCFLCNYIFTHLSNVQITVYITHVCFALSAVQSIDSLLKYFISN